VAFASSAVAMGTGFETLQRLMNEHTAGTGDGVSRVTFGWRRRGAVWRGSASADAPPWLPRLAAFLPYDRAPLRCTDRQPLRAADSSIRMCSFGMRSEQTSSPSRVVTDHVDIGIIRRWRARSGDRPCARYCCLLTASPRGDSFHFSDRPWYRY